VYVVVIARINWQQSSEIAVARALGGAEMLDEETPNVPAASHIPTPKPVPSRKSGMAASKSSARGAELIPLTTIPPQDIDDEKVEASVVVAPTVSSSLDKLEKPKTSFRYGLSTRLQEATVDDEADLYKDDDEVEIDFSNDLLLADDEEDDI
jgi:hypothetical protein